MFSEAMPINRHDSAGYKESAIFGSVRFQRAAFGILPNAFLQDTSAGKMARTARKMRALPK